MQGASTSTSCITGEAADLLVARGILVRRPSSSNNLATFFLRQRKNLTAVPSTGACRPVASQCTFGPQEVRMGEQGLHGEDYGIVRFGAACPHG